MEYVWFLDLFYFYLTVDRQPKGNCLFAKVNKTYIILRFSKKIAIPFTIIYVSRHYHILFIYWIFKSDIQFFKYNETFFNGFKKRFNFWNKYTFLVWQFKKFKIKQNSKSEPINSRTGRKLIMFFWGGDLFLNLRGRFKANMNEDCNFLTNDNCISNWRKKE